MSGPQEYSPTDPMLAQAISELRACEKSLRDSDDRYFDMLCRVAVDHALCRVAAPAENIEYVSGYVEGMRRAIHLLSREGIDVLV